jgi:large subunit ribosomal protein L23
VAGVKDPVQVVQRPLISEKSYAAMATGKYLFKVHPRATKTEIAIAVAAAFKVDVVSVNTMHVRGKERRRGRTHGFQPDWKKAVVTLAEGQKIESMFQGV